MTDFVVKHAAFSLFPQSFASSESLIQTSPRIGSRERYRLALFALFATELLVFAYFQRARLLSFDYYFFQDQGTNLVACYLTNNGLRPAIDFGYNWGLLGLLFGRVWFSAFGATPIVCEAGLFVTAGLGVAWALARIAARLDLNPPSIAIVMLTLPFSARFMPPSFAHGLEAALIANAIAFQLERRNALALALSAAALFARPAIGYFYGVWLLGFIARDLYRRGSVSIEDLKLIIPAASTALCLAVLLAAAYGTRSLILTLVPFQGAANYHASHYGFFNEGKSFLFPHRAGWIWYLGTPAGIWIAASLWLFVRSAQFLPDILAGRASARQELTVTCAFLHAVFVLVMFGNSWTWTYYFFILIIGTIAASEPITQWQAAGRFQRVYLNCLVALSFLFCLSYIQQLNPGYSRDPTTGLWWSADQSRQWSRAMDLVKGKRAALMIEAGGGALMSSAFQKPVAMYLLPAFQVGSEPDREARQLKESDVIVTTTLHPTSLGSCLNYYPKLREAIGTAPIVFHGTYLTVYQRISDAPR